MNKINYNPDILSCLANLSNDEVFTPPEIVNKMLDLLPEDLFQNKNITFLDPVCKSGVFLREIAKRLNDGLKKEIPDKQERVNHIFKHQLFGIAITELTSLLSRRSVYCSKKANGEYSVSKEFKTEEGNIKYKRFEHLWENGKCKFCSANESQYGRGEELENYAYGFIHTDQPESIFNMRFDVIIGNPPYQLTDGSGGSSDSAVPIYNKFIEQAIKLNPRYISMIIPSKWMVGGRGLNKFRENMMGDKRMKSIYDFEDASNCFSGLHIDGGVNYFLWEKDYNGKVEYTFKPSKGQEKSESVYLKNDYFDYVIRDNRVLTILDKVKGFGKFSSIVSTTKPYGIRKYLFNEPERYPNSNLQFDEYPNALKIHGVKGIKGGAKRTVGFVEPSLVTKSNNLVDKHKIFFTTSYSTNATIPPAIILAGPKTICTETFLSIGPFENEEEQFNCKSYIESKIFRFLLYFGKGTMQVNQAVFGLIPLISFKESWTDKKLYDLFKLDAKEISMINDFITAPEL